MIDTRTLKLSTMPKDFMTPDECRHAAAGAREVASIKRRNAMKIRRSNERWAPERANELVESARKLDAIADELEAAAEAETKTTRTEQ